MSDIITLASNNLLRIMVNKEMASEENRLIVRKTIKLYKDQFCSPIIHILSINI